MQKKIIKILSVVFVVILIPALVVGGAYGFIWWKVSTAADQFATDIAPFAEMKYQQVHINLPDTEVGLKGVSFTPSGMDGEIGIDAAILKAPSWGFLLDLEEKLNSGEFPESFNLAMTGLSVDLNSGYMKQWANMATDMQHQAGQSYDALGCGERKYFSVADLRKMGYSTISSDISLQYGFDSQERQLYFDMQSKTGQIADMSLSFVVKVASDTLNAQTVMFAQPELRKVETRFKDKGYNVRRNRFCAKGNEETVEQYREKYKLLLAQKLKGDGWTIPDSILTGFDGLNKPGGSLYLRVDIPQGFGMQSMMLVEKPSDLIDALTPYVEFNGKPVFLDGVSWEQPDPNAHTEIAAVQSSPLMDETESSAESEKNLADSQEEVQIPEEQKALGRTYFPNPKPRPAPKSFKPVSLSELKHHLGEPVVIHTYFGRKIEGKLIGASSSVITVEHRLVDGRGTATYPISTKKIETAQLYR